MERDTMGRFFQDLDQSTVRGYEKDQNDEMIVVERLSSKHIK